MGWRGGWETNGSWTGGVCISSSQQPLEWHTEIVPS